MTVLCDLPLRLLEASLPPCSVFIASSWWLPVRSQPRLGRGGKCDKSSSDIDSCGRLDGLTCQWWQCAWLKWPDDCHVKYMRKKVMGLPKSLSGGQRIIFPIKFSRDKIRLCFDHFQVVVCVCGLLVTSVVLFSKATLGRSSLEIFGVWGGSEKGLQDLKKWGIPSTPLGYICGKNVNYQAHSRPMVSETQGQDQVICSTRFSSGFF